MPTKLDRPNSCDQRNKEFATESAVRPDLSKICFCVRVFVIKQGTTQVCVGSNQIINARSVVDRLAGPHHGVGVGGDVQVGVVVANGIEAERAGARSGRRWRNARGQGLNAAVALVEEMPAVDGVGFDAKAAFVQQAMVRGAEQHQVAKFGFAAVGPMLNMVAVDVTAMGAAGKAAGAVAQQQGALDGWRD